MKKNLFKYLILFFSFSTSIVISIYTFFSYVPKDNVPDIFPLDKEKKVIHLLPKNENKLEIYNIISPESLKKKDNISQIKSNEREEKLENDQKIQVIKENYKLQLGSLRDYENAKKEYKKLTIKYPNFFKAPSPMIEKIDFPDKGIFYRIKSSESFIKEEAQEICRVLTLDKKKCLVIKND
ncbi:SPOR domain-containing protein [Rickettsiales bacterium]|nr:SPOR domain-containing protein [Rickettsiales bacterium]